MPGSNHRTPGPLKSLASSAKKTRFRTLPWLPGFRIGNDGTIEFFDGEKWVPRRLTRTYDGYSVIHVSLGGNKSARKRVHRLVAEAFLGVCPNGMQVAHNDGNKENNHVSNLRYDTPKGNNADKVSHGRLANGERNGKSKFTESAVRAIRSRYAAGESVASIHRDFDCSDAAIRLIISGDRWGHVT